MIEAHKTHKTREFPNNRGITSPMPQLNFHEGGRRWESRMIHSDLMEKGIRVKCLCGCWEHPAFRI